MSIPFSTKVNERAVPLAIVSEPHIIGIIATATYSPGNIRLTEVPQGPTPNVFIPGYIEIPSGAPVGTQFVVDYTTGVITFNVAQDGNSILVSYTGLGSEIAAEDVNELQNPLSTIATQSIVYNWPSAPTVSWSLAANIVKPANISNTGTDDFLFPRNVTVTNLLTASGVNSSAAVTLINQSPVIFQDTSLVAKTVTLEAPTTITTSYTLKWPLLQGAAGTFLQNDGSGNLSFVPASGSFVSSITGTPNQVIASASTGPVTLSLPQSIATSSGVQFGTLGLGAPLVSSAILSLTSTVQGFLLPRMNTTQRDAIVSPATGLEIFNTTTNEPEFWNGSAWEGSTTTNPGGADTNVQFNNAGAFGGTPEFTWNETTRTLSLTSLTTTTSINVTSAANSFLNLNAAGTDGVVGYAQNGTTLRGSLTFSSSVVQLNSSNDMSLNIPTAHTLALNVDTLSILTDGTGVAIGTGGAHDQFAILDLQTVTQGFLPPRMTTTQRNSIGSFAFLLSQGITYTSKLVGTVGNSYSVTVIDSGTGGLSYTEPAGALQIDLGGTTPSTASVVTLINTTFPSAFVTAFETTPGTVVIHSIQSLAGGVNPSEGLIVYDTTDHQWYGWNSTSWAILG